jgi:HEAT repeat protein
MLRTRYCVVYAVLAAMMIPSLGETRPPDAAETRQRQLIDVLQSDAPPQDKAMACKHLAIYGQQDAVPALAALLPDEQLASWARIALEVIPGPAADDALRDALGRLQGRLLVGAINSIGTRRDAQAVERLAERLGDADAAVASAAAVALGRIGDVAAAKALEQALASAPSAVRSAIAEGCILCAERFQAEGKSPEAVRIYDLVRQADVPAPRIAEATRGAILARQADGVPLLLEQLRSDDKAMLAIGLRTARELAGGNVTEALVAELELAPPDRQTLLILALADRGDASALPAVLQAARRGPDSVRIVALRVLQRLGDASYVPVLLEAALQDNQELAQTATSVLVELPGKDVDDDVSRRLASAEGQARRLLIEVAGRRGIVAATAALLRAADDPDREIRTAALTALGYTVPPRDLPVLIGRVVHPAEDPAEAGAAEAALRAACERMPDREDCAGKLVAAMPQAPVPARCTLLEILSVLGGENALRAVAAAAKDADGQIQDTGSRLLGEWMTLDAGPVLLDLARNASDPKYEIRALRGYIRLARQFVMPDPQRAEMCRTALEVAQRDAEKKLVLEVLERYPSVDMLRIAVEAAKTPSLKDDAAGAAMAIAQKIGGDADVQQLLARVGHDPVKVEIIKAEYGEGTRFRDVTAALRQHVRDFPLIVLPSSGYNASFGGDPAPGVVKSLKIQYRIDGRPGEVSLRENAAILLPMPTQN